jgi:hypothetical protein
MKQPARQALLQNIKWTHGKGWEILDSQTDEGY